MANPWDIQEGETPKSFAAFCVYRDMGKGRSLDSAWRVQGGGRTGTAPSYYTEWSAKYAWVGRATAYDAHLSSVAVGSAEDGIKQDRLEYRNTVKREAAAFAESAVAMRREAMLMEDKDTASRVLQRAAAVWEKARQVEGMALGLVSE